METDIRAICNQADRASHLYTGAPLTWIRALTEETELNEGDVVVCLLSSVTKNGAKKGPFLYTAVCPHACLEAIIDTVGNNKGTSTRIEPIENPPPTLSD